MHLHTIFFFSLGQSVTRLTKGHDVKLAENSVMSWKTESLNRHSQ